jgi:hypothetical protein
VDDASNPRCTNLRRTEAFGTSVAPLPELASHGQLTPKGDLTKLLTTGFPTQKTRRNPVGMLSLSSVTVKLGELSGDLAAK